MTKQEYLRRRIFEIREELKNPRLPANQKKIQCRALRLYQADLDRETALELTSRQ